MIQYQQIVAALRVDAYLIVECQAADLPFDFSSCSSGSTLPQVFEALTKKADQGQLPCQVLRQRIDTAAKLETTRSIFHVLHSRNDVGVRVSKLHGLLGGTKEVVAIVQLLFY